MGGANQFVDPVEVEVKSNLGADVADDGTVPAFLPPTGLAVMGEEAATTKLFILRVNASGQLIVVGGGGIAPLNVFVGASPTFFTAGVASAPAIAANAARKWISITVTTAGGQISLGLDGNAAVLGSGITVFTGQPVVFDADGVSLGAIAIIANMAGVNVSIQQGA